MARGMHAMLHSSELMVLLVLSTTAACLYAASNAYFGSTIDNHRATMESQMARQLGALAAFTAKAKHATKTWHTSGMHGSDAIQNT